MVWNRFKLNRSSKITNPAPATNSTSATNRVIHRFFVPLITNDAPNTPIPSNNNGTKNIQGTVESGGTNGRANAKANNATNKQRAAIRSMSSHSIRRFRIATVSNKKRIAPQSNGFAACRRIKCSTIGTRTPANPTNNHVLRKSIQLSVIRPKEDLLPFSRFL